VEVAVDLDRVRVGMQVLMYADTPQGAQVVARGVVEDLANGRAATRLVDVIAPTVNFTPSTRVQFVNQSAVASQAAHAFGALR
jgi:multidrug resistance efflux pump